MDNKRQISYEKILEAVRDDIAPGWKPRYVISDFETAIRNAADAVYSGIEKVGCFFHFTQAIQRHWRSCGLIKEFRKDPVGIKLKRMVMALPLAPPEMIARLFTKIVNSVPDNMASKMNHFLKYVFEQWIHGFGANNLSVYNKKSFRTNNASEAINKSLNALLGSIKKPSAMIFTRLLLQHQTCTHTKVISMVERGLRVHFHKKKTSSESVDTNALKLYWSQLKNGVISPERFYEKIIRLIASAAREALQMIQGDPDKIRRIPRSKNFVFWARISVNNAGSHQIFVDGINHFDPDMRRRLIQIGETKITEASTTMGGIPVD
ncbi:uncharacterized protein [Venturia canescens]|uniref:uncharacterized protein n=1 Tax=Venturia canescens TaxID=32260 RepID=UPI001C9D0D74|nr:uncharacterized protein LOC122408019 [Venturia canescens]